MKTDILEIIQKHVGRNNPIPRKELLGTLNLSSRYDRKVRLLIGELRHDGIPILFGTSYPHGYYLPANLLELKEGIDKYRSYVIDECITIRDLKIKGRQYIDGEKQGALL